MTQAVFYQCADEQVNELELACYILATWYQPQTYISVLCTDEAQAKALDEQLWILPPERFIAHNLVNEGNGKTPIELTWPGAGKLRSITVNLTSQALPNAHRYQTVIDVVPHDEKGKALARERYKQLQQLGCQMQFNNLKNLQEINPHG